MSRVDVSELMREMYYGVMGWFTRERERERHLSVLFIRFIHLHNTYR